MLVADAEKAAKILGWTPEYPDLESMVRSAWDWRANSSTTRVTLRR
jgi:UDP-glucose 4-epimerase